MAYIIARWILECSGLDGVGDEAEDGADPEQQREAAEQLLTELHPLGRRLGRRQLIGAVALEHLLGLRRRQALCERASERGEWSRAATDTYCDILV